MQWRTIFAWAGALILVLATLSTRASAQDAAALVKQVRDDIRSANSALMRGEAEEADRLLRQAQENIEKLKAISPDHPQLKSVESSYERARKDVDAKLPARPAGQSSPAAPQGSAPAPQGSAAELVEQASSAARKALRALSHGKANEAAEALSAGKAALSQAEKSGAVEGLNAARAALTAAETLHAPMTDSAKNTRLPIVVRGRSGAVAQRLDRVEDHLDKAPQPGAGTVDGFIRDLRTELAQLRKELGTPQDDADTTLHGALATSQTPTDHPQIAAILARHEMVVARTAEVEERLTGSATVLTDRKGIDEEIAALADAARKAEGAISQAFVHLSPDIAEPEALEKRLGEIETIEQEHINALREKLAAFEAQYGNSAEAILKKMAEIDYRESGRAITAWESARKQSTAVADHRSHMAGEIMQQVNRVLDESDKLHDFVFEERVSLLRPSAKLALKFDPANEQAGQVDQTVERREKELLDAYNARVDGRKWSGHAEVANAAELAQAAMQFLAAHPEWGQSKKATVEVRAVAVTADWRVTLKDLTGRPTQWGLPILVAVKHSADGDKPLLRVFELTAVNREEADAKPNPPFTGYHVGNSWHIRPATVE